MEITNIQIRKTFDDGKSLKAIVSVTFDNKLAVHDLKVIDTGEKQFVAFPSRRTSEGSFIDIVHPVGADSRSYIESAILSEYYNHILGDSFPEGEKNDI